MRLSTVYRVEYVTDPNWEYIPISDLISKDYAATLDTMIKANSVVEKIHYGNPTKYVSDIPKKCSKENKEVAETYLGSTDLNSQSQFSPSFFYNCVTKNTVEQVEIGETTHISIVYPDGNAVSLSTTLSHVFDSRAWVSGFLLNNSGFNFSNFKKEKKLEC